MFVKNTKEGIKHLFQLFDFILRPAGKTISAIKEHVLKARIIYKWRHNTTLSSSFVFIDATLSDVKKPNPIWDLNLQNIITIYRFKLLLKRFLITREVDLKFDAVFIPSVLSLESSCKHIKTRRWWDSCLYYKVMYKFIHRFNIKAYFCHAGASFFTSADFFFGLAFFFGLWRPFCRALVLKVMHSLSKISVTCDRVHLKPVSWK